MKYYGLDKELVHAAILHHILSTCEDFQMLPVEGGFVKKKDGVYFRTDTFGKRMDVRLGSSLKDEQLEQLNHSISRQRILSTTENGEKRYHLLFSVGETEEEAKAELDKQVVEHFVDFMNIKSKNQLKAFIRLFENAFSF